MCVIIFHSRQKQIQTDKENPLWLHLASNGRTHTLIFKEDRYCTEVKKEVDHAKTVWRDDRIKQVTLLLNSAIG